MYFCFCFCFCYSRQVVSVKLTPSSDPLFQRTLVNVVRRCESLFRVSNDVHTAGPHDWVGLPVVFDEVFAGMYRLGRLRASSFLGVHPDISVHGKLLTGGLVPLCATLATQSIFEAFDDDDAGRALLHGHSYTAHAVGCQVALETLKEMDSMNTRGAWGYRWARASGWPVPEPPGEGPPGPPPATASPTVWSVWNREFVERVSHQTGVDGVWALGTVLAIHMKSSDGAGYKSDAARGIQKALLQGPSSRPAESRNVHSRGLGNVLYLMTSLKTQEDVVRRLEARLLAVLDT